MISMFSCSAIPIDSFAITLFYTLPHTVFLAELELGLYISCFGFFYQFSDIFW